MYWGQLAISLAFGLWVGFTLFENGEPIGVATVGGALVFIGVRWLLAWAFRTRFWYKNGGRVWKRCQDCGEGIWRVGGDWVLQCKRCGWTRGWPGLRWITHSVPSIQLRRTVNGPMLVLAVFLGAMLLTGVAGSITMAGVESTLESVNSGMTQNPKAATETGDSVTAPSPTVGGVQSTDESRSTPIDTTPIPEDFNQSVAEQTVHFEINEIRQSRELSTLNFDPELQAIARQHSEAMAEEGYIYHSGTDGDLQDRFDRTGYDCRVSVSSNRYATGGENVAKTWFRERIIGGAYYSTAEAVGEGLVEQWMDSSGHRENILREYWKNEGIGIVTVEEDGKTAVYATQVFC